MDQSDDTMLWISQNMTENVLLFKNSITKVESNTEDNGKGKISRRRTNRQHKSSYTKATITTTKNDLN